MNVLLTFSFSSSSGLQGSLAHFSAQARKIKKKTTLKKFLIFSQKKLILYFGKRNFLIFYGIELSSSTNKKLQERTFRAQKIKKKPTLKKFLIFWKMELCSPKIKKVLMFSLKKVFLIFREIKTSLKKSFISGGNLQNSKNKKS